MSLVRNRNSMIYIYFIVLRLHLLIFEVERCICLSINYAIIGSYKDLLPVHSMIWISAGLSFIGSMKKHFKSTSVTFQFKCNNFSFHKMNLKMLSAKCLHFCSRLYMLDTHIHIRDFNMLIFNSSQTCILCIIAILQPTLMRLLRKIAGYIWPHCAASSVMDGWSTSNNDKCISVNSRDHFYAKMMSYNYKNSIYRYNTVSWGSSVHNGNAYTCTCKTFWHIHMCIRLYINGHQ